MTKEECQLIINKIQSDGLEYAMMNYGDVSVDPDYNVLYEQYIVSSTALVDYLQEEADRHSIEFDIW